MTISNNDSGIPILTEVIPEAATNAAPKPDAATPPAFLMRRETDLQSEASRDAAHSQSVRPPAQPTAQQPVPPSVRRSADVAPELSPMTNADLKSMEHRISERVLAQMMNRIDFVLEQRIRDSLSEVVRSAVADLSKNIRTGLQQTLEEAITRAVAQEVAQLQKQKA